MSEKDVLDVLNEMRAFARERKIPVILDDTRAFFENICKDLKPLNILEIGMAIGYSGAVMLLSSPTDCTITELEASTPNIALARENYKRLGLLDRVNIIEGDCLDTLDSLKGQKFDLIFLDGPKGKYIEILEKLLPLLHERGMLIADNIGFRGMVEGKNEITEPRFSFTVCVLREFLDIIKNDMRLNSKVYFEIGDGLVIVQWRNNKLAISN